MTESFIEYGPHGSVSFVGPDPTHLYQVPV